MAPIHEAVIRSEVFLVDDITKGNPAQLESRLDQYIGLDNAEGSTPLILAARVENDHILRVLLERGANTNAYDDARKTALWYAARSGNSGIIFLLINQATDVNLSTPLTVATMQGHEEAVGLLLRHGGANINAQNEQGKTAIYEACAFGRTRIFRTLIEAGGDISITDHHGMTPLMAAAQHGLLAMMKLLIKQRDGGRNGILHINAKDSKGRTALYHTCCQSKIQLTR